MAKTVTDPITEITDISLRMANLDFEAKYIKKPFNVYELRQIIEELKLE